MKLKELKVTKETIDIKKNIVTYETNVESNEQGIILLNDQVGDHDMVIVRLVHLKGPVVVVAKPVKVPAKRYLPGDVIGFLATFS